MDDLSSFCCLNPACADLGKRGHGNLTVTARYGLSKSRRMLRCRTCATRFSERKGTPLFDARLPPEKVTAVLAHVAEGVGTRKTARLTGVHTDTVTRYTRLAGDHAEQLHDELVAFSPKTNAVQFDEKGAFVNKKQKNCRPDDVCGDCWDRVAFDPETRSVVSLGVGKRTAEAARALIRDFRRRTGNRVMRLMTSDEYPHPLRDLLQYLVTGHLRRRRPDPLERLARLPAEARVGALVLLEIGGLSAASRASNSVSRTAASSMGRRASAG